MFVGQKVSANGIEPDPKKVNESSSQCNLSTCVADD